MSRPTKQEAVAIHKRNNKMLAMDQKGYPLDYIATFFNLTKGRVVQILKLKVEEEKKNAPGQRETK